MKLGIERLIEEPALRKPLAGRRVALLAHPASVTRDLTHSLDALAALSGVRLSAARSEEHTSELQSQSNLVCRLLLEKKKKKPKIRIKASRLVVTRRWLCTLISSS